MTRDYGHGPAPLARDAKSLLDLFSVIPDFVAELNLSEEKLRLVRRLYPFMGTRVEKSPVARIIIEGIARANRHLETDPKNEDQVMEAVAGQLLDTTGYRAYTEAIASIEIMDDRFYLGSSGRSLREGICLLLIAALSTGNSEAVGEITRIETPMWIELSIMWSSPEDVIWPYIESGSKLPLNWWLNLSFTPSGRP